MHNLENRIHRASKRAKNKPIKHEKIVCRVLKKFKIQRNKQPHDHPSSNEPVLFIAYDPKSIPLTMLAFLEAGNRKRKSRLVKSPVKKLETEDIEKEASEENVYCECKRPYCPGELMFKCEGFCEGWYHPECMKMKPDEVERQKISSERWYCPSCIFQAQKIVLDTTNRASLKKFKINAQE